MSCECGVLEINLTLWRNRKNFYPIKPKMILAKTELRETNSTKNQYTNHEFQSGFTTILPMQIREVKFVFHKTDVSGLVLCSILTGENIKIIDQEIIENVRSYKLFKLGEFFVIQLAG